MLINLRNALMAGKRLPYDAEVEYLESTGTQWINTGVTPTPSDTTRIVADLSLTSINTGDNNIIFGSYIETPTVRQFAFVDRTAKARIAYVGAASGTVTVATGTDYLFEAQFAAGNSYLNVNGATSSQNTSTATVLPTQPMALFACRYADSVISPTSMRLRSCKIYLNNVLVRDFIPVRKGTVGYLYDRVSGALFGNAGTGDFVVGQDVVPVEYIESHGTEWINTGTIASECSQAELSFAVRTLGFRNFLFGCNSSTYGFAEVSTGNLFKTEATSTYSILPLVQYKAIFYKSDFSVVVNGTTLNIVCGTSAASIFSRNANFAISATAVGSQYHGKMLIYGLKLYSDSGIFHSYKPIRVGSGSTWEGAMLDTVNRRVYRNAGTGAFTYGNDLKYPIPAS